MTIDELKAKSTISREDIGQLLSSIGEPGKKQDEKIKVVRSLERSNRQGHGIEVTLESYSEF